MDYKLVSLVEWVPGVVTLDPVREKLPVKVKNVKAAIFSRLLLTWKPLLGTGAFILSFHRVNIVQP